MLSNGAALIFAAALAVASPLLQLTVVPWNTTVAVVAVMVALLVATSDRRDWKTAATLGLALSLCYAARFTDVLWPIIIASAGLIGGTKAEHSKSTQLVAIAGGMLAVTYICVGWTQHAVFGSFFSNPYHYHLHDGVRGDTLTEFHISQVPRAFVEVFLTGRSNGQPVPGPYSPVLRAFP